MLLAASASELFCMTLLTNNERFSYHSNPLSIKFYIHVNSSASADENQLWWEMAHFLSEMSKTHLLALEVCRSAIGGAYNIKNHTSLFDYCIIT